LDRRILAIGLIAVVVVAIGAVMFLQPKQNQPAPTQGKELVVITRHDSAIQNLFEQAYLQSDYAKEYNITSVRFLETPVSYWAATIENGGVDVAWGGGPTLFNQMLQLGLLQPITGTEALSIVNQLPRKWGTAIMRIDNGQGNPLWVAAAISSFGFTANTGFLHRYNLSEPLLWTDLSSPDFNRDFPTIALAKPSLSTSHTRIYSIILQAFGWDTGWSMLDRIAANGRIYDGSVESQTAVETGEVGISISIDYYGYTSHMKDPTLDYILPAGESIVNGDPIAIVNGTQNKQAAEAFAAFVLSVQGQTLWLDPTLNRMPVRSDVFQTTFGRTRPDLYAYFNLTVAGAGFDFNETEDGLIEQSMTTYFESTLVDLHDQLVEVWSLMATKLKDGTITQERFNQLLAQLTAPLSWTEDNGTARTFTEAYAMSINYRLLTDNSFALSMASIWRSAASARYAAVKTALGA